MVNSFNLYSPFYDLFMRIFRLYRPGLIRKAIQPNKSQLVLDIGGGTGYLAAMLKPLVKTILIVDHSFGMLKSAQRRGLAVCQCDALSLPFPDRSFDSVLCTDALHHIKEHEVAIREIARILKPDGRLVILEFDIRGLTGWIFWMFEKIFIDNSRFIRSRQLKILLEHNGFIGRISRISTIEYLYTGRLQ